MCVLELLLAVALVPMPREFRPVEGSCRQEILLPCPKLQWWDFDVKGACLDALSVKVTTDVAVPAEGYRLKVLPDFVEIAASDSAGEFYARQTLRQLAEQVSSNAIEIGCCDIRDWPQYRWRGLMLDEARHFLGKGAVKRTIELMAMHKLNVLHWHLTDDQGWRLALRRHPELVAYGAVRPCSVKMGAHAKWLSPDNGLSYAYDTEKYGPYFYSPEDIMEVLAFAKEHHVKIVPEIEIPGHVRALLAAHPEFSCRGNLSRIPRIDWSIEEDVLCVGNDAALKFLEDVFDEVCELFPDTPYIHIGGDECPRVRWKNCPKCQKRLKDEGLKDETELQAWVTSRFVRHLEGKGRRAVGWDEILAGDVPKSAVGMTWRTSAENGAGTVYVSAAEAVGRGHDMVMAPMETCYLSFPQFASGDPYPYYSPWAKPLTLEKAYSFDPTANIPESCRERILGGQACVWGESTFTVFDLEWKTWPRACAIAEVLWLGSVKPGYQDFVRRLKDHRQRLIASGVVCAPLGEVCFPMMPKVQPRRVLQLPQQYLQKQKKGNATL